MHIHWILSSQVFLVKVWVFFYVLSAVIIKIVIHSYGSCSDFIRNLTLCVDILCIKDKMKYILAIRTNNKCIILKLEINIKMILSSLR